ncbi:MAG: DUF3857 domain-containing protein [Acidobacteria bacterium]|nr:DUF3857 domain-containing protein [Acidobacteriota bacterium]
MPRFRISPSRAGSWLVCLLALLSAALPAHAQEPPAPRSDDDLRALIANAGGRDENGGADVVKVFRRTRVEVEPSGLAHIYEHHLLKCLSAAGAAELARVRLDFDPASNVIELRSLRVLRKSGAVETVDAAAGVELPQPQHMIYWGPRMRLYAVPRLEPGDALEIQTYMKGFLIAYLDDLAGGAAGAAPGGSADDKYVPPMRGHFYDVITFQEDTPVKLRHYEVVTPKDKPVQFEVYNGEVKSYVTFDDGHLVYRFWKEDLPAYRSEPRASDRSDIATKVVLATVPDWQTKSRWFAEVNDRQFDADDAIRGKVAELTRGMTRDEDKIAALVHWSADNIRYSGVSMGQGEGYTLQPGPMIFRNRSGVCKDKAGMAITMLRAAGFTVYPAMTMAGSRVERIPADQFNHCVAALKKGDGTFELLDPTWVVFSPEEWSSAEGEQNYLVGSPEGQPLAITPAFDPVEKNRLRLESNATLAADGTLTGTLAVTASELAEQRLRRELIHGFGSADRQAWFERLVGGIGPGAEVQPMALDYAQLQDVTKPLRLEARYRIANYALVGKDAIWFVPPMARHPLRSASFAPFGTAELEKRTQPLQLGAPRYSELSETITLPPGWTVGRLPEDRKIEGPVASLATHAEGKGGQLTYSYRLKVSRREVPVASYANFREVLQAAEKLAEDRVVLVRGTPAGRKDVPAPAPFAAVPAAAGPAPRDGEMRRDVTIRLERDGRVIRRHESSLKMLTDFVNRTDLNDPRIDWNDARAEMKIERARALGQDGHVVETQANSLVPNTAEELQWAVPYAHLRELTVAHVGVELGGTTELAYTIADRAPSGVPLWGALELDAPVPLVAQRVRFELPDGTKLAYAQPAGLAAPEIATRDGVVSYTFDLRDVPPRVLAELPGGALPPGMLVYSAAPGWAFVSRWLGERLAPALAADAAVKARAAELAGETLSSAERLARIHEFVVDGVRTIHWPLEAFDYAARPAGEVLASSVGHPLDKAVLLAALLREAGFAPRVALATAGRAFAAEVPSPAQFEDAWVAVALGGRTLWLDPTAPHDRRNAAQLAGRWVLVPDAGEAAAQPVQVPELDPSSNAALLRAELKLAPPAGGGPGLRLGGVADLDLGGTYDPLAGFDRSQDRYGALARGVASRFGAQAKDTFVARDTGEELALRVELADGALGESLAADAPLALVLPRVPGALSAESLQLYRPRRTLPLAIAAPAREVVEVVLQLPEGWEAARVPEELALAGDAASATRSVRRDGSKLTIRTELKLARAVIEPGVYPQLRAALAAVDSEAARTVILRRVSR